MSGAPQEAVLQEACVNVRSRDRPRRVEGKVKAEPGGSIMVKVPSRARKKPWSPPLACWSNPMIAPPR
jgi:hypothetical protein